MSHDSQSAFVTWTTKKGVQQARNTPGEEKIMLGVYVCPYIGNSSNWLNRLQAAKELTVSGSMCLFFFFTSIIVSPIFFTYCYLFIRLLYFFFFHLYYYIAARWFHTKISVCVSCAGNNGDNMISAFIALETALYILYLKGLLLESNCHVNNPRAASVTSNHRKFLYIAERDILVVFSSPDGCHFVLISHAFIHDLIHYFYINEHSNTLMYTRTVLI